MVLGCRIRSARRGARDGDGGRPASPIGRGSATLLAAVSVVAGFAVTGTAVAQVGVPILSPEGETVA